MRYCSRIYRSRKSPRRCECFIAAANTECTTTRARTFANHPPEFASTSVSRAFISRASRIAVAGLRACKTLSFLRARFHSHSSTPRRIKAAITRLSGTFNAPAEMSALYLIFVSQSIRFEQGNKRSLVPDQYISRQPCDTESKEDVAAILLHNGRR
jgi:hypothetical protein